VVNNFLFECVEDDTQIRIIVEKNDMFIYGPTGLIITKCDDLVRVINSDNLLSASAWERSGAISYVNTQIRFLVVDNNIYINSLKKKYVLNKKQRYNRKPYKITKDPAHIFEQIILKYIKTD
jgi:hypothetical protein